MKYMPGSISQNHQLRSKRKGTQGRKRKILWGTSRRWKKTQILTVLLAHLSRNSEILFSTRSISSLLVSWLMGYVLRFSIITTESTGISVRWPSWTHLMQVSSREREGRITFSISDYVSAFKRFVFWMGTCKHIQIILPLYGRTWLISTRKVLRRKQE